MMVMMTNQNEHSCNRRKSNCWQWLLQVCTANSSIISTTRQNHDDDFDDDDVDDDDDDDDDVDYDDDDDLNIK